MKEDTTMKTGKTRTYFAAATAALALALFAGTSAQAATLTLFADTFDRADSADLNAVTTGKSGTLGALDWVEVGTTGANANDRGSSEIASNQLAIGNEGAGSGWAIAYLDHNFTDAAISTGGEFTVTTDISIGGLSGGTRFNGFAVGHSLAEVSGWSANNPTNFASDFFFGYDPTGTKEVKIFTGGGTQVHQRGVDLDSGAELSVRFTLSDFNSGSTVNYEAFVDGVSEDTGSFTWSGTSENYITTYSNVSGLSGFQDNFAVTTVPEPASLAMGLMGLTMIVARRRR